MPSVVVHPPPFGGQTSPDGLGGDPVEPRRDDGLGAGLVNRACAGVADHHEAWRLEPDDRTRGFLRVPFTHPEGTRHGYDNATTYVLARMVERVTGGKALPREVIQQIARSPVRPMEYPCLWKS